MTYGIDDVSRLPRLLIPSLFVVVAMAQIQPFILEPEYSSEEELPEDEDDELDLPVDINLIHRAALIHLSLSFSSLGKL